MILLNSYFVRSLKRSILDTVFLGMIVLFPIFGGILSSAINISQNKRRLKYIVLMISIGLISIFNATKIPESDLADYLIYYHQLKDISISQFLVRFGNEPIFYVFSWLIGIFTDFSDYWFKYLSSIFGLMLLAFSAFRYSELKLGKLKWSVMISIIALCLFPVIFSNSLHLIRQFFALGIFILGLSVSGKFRVVVWTLAVLTHVSSVVLIIFAINGKKIQIIQIFTIIFIFFLGSIAPILRSHLSVIDLGTITYLLSRATQASYHDMVGVGNLHIAFIIFVMSLCLLPKTTNFARLLRIDYPELRRVLIGLGSTIIILTLVYNFHEPSARLFYYFIVLTLLNFIVKMAKFQGASMLVSVSYLFISCLAWVLLMMGSGTWSYNTIQLKTILSPILFHVL